jgi:hypothetical protein
MIRIELIVEQKGRVTKFVNKSAYDIFLCEKPTKPKRLVHCFQIVRKHSYLVIDVEGFDLSRVYISFENLISDKEKENV